jgi:SAM-dependent methyltransferase
MPIYDRFAKHYQSGPYTQFTRRVISEVFPRWLELLDFQPQTLLDLACGSGEFALAQAEAGLQVTGLDQSARFLALGQAEAKARGLKLSWVQGDMTRFDLGQEFDCVTSWFDSLNYLLHVEELAAAFKQVAAHLAPGGYFLFDMNTIYGITVQWQRFPYYLQQETADYIEFAENTCDYENSIATMRLIMFERDGKAWRHFEESHRERGYAIDDILLLLGAAGLTNLHVTGDPRLMSPLGSQDGRVWIAARKGA